jgi:hypothetical protein
VVHAMLSLQTLLDVAQRRALTRREEQLLSRLLLEDDHALEEYLSRCQFEADLRFYFAKRTERTDDDAAPN